MMNATVATQQPSRSWIYRVAVFAYGISAYAIGVAALLAIILLMLGVLQFTGGPFGAVGLGAGIAVDVVLLVAFALQHSVMARASFKTRWTRIVPAAAERSTYVLATGLVLALLLLLWRPMPAVVWSVEAPMLRWCLLAVALAGWAYLFAASFAINHFELFGLQQVYQALRARPVTSAPFRERWMYRFDRHPIMSGMLVGIWATPTMRLDHLLFAAGSTLYIGSASTSRSARCGGNGGRRTTGTVSASARSCPPSPGDEAAPALRHRPARPAMPSGETLSTSGRYRFTIDRHQRTSRTFFEMLGYR